MTNTEAEKRRLQGLATSGLLDELEKIATEAFVPSGFYPLMNELKERKLQPKLTIIGDELTVELNPLHPEFQRKGWIPPF
jgi:hypothetical protein